MSDLTCRYRGDREQAIVSYLYDESDGAEGAEFERHLSACARCRMEVGALKGVRADLRAWAAPEPADVLVRPHALMPDAARFARRPWWRDAPAWAQAAAAILLIGVAAGAANLDIRYDASGLRVRTGWSRPPGAPAAVGPTAAPWRADLTELEQRLRADSKSAAAAAAANPANRASSANPVNPEVLRRVRTLIDDSERRQQRELALRVAEVMRDVNAERQSDLARIERTMGAMQNTTGIEMMRQRETINSLLVRTSLQK